MQSTSTTKSPPTLSKHPSSPTSKKSNQISSKSSPTSASPLSPSFPKTTTTSNPSLGQEDLDPHILPFSPSTTTSMSTSDPPPTPTWGLDPTLSDPEREGQVPKAIRLSPAVDLVNLNFKINAPPKHRPVRIYCDGIYDMFHYGHARCLEQAKTAFPNVYLLVGVCNDQVTHARKGKTVMRDIERFESLRHCKWVDEVIENAPWVIDQAFMDQHKIDYVAHDNIPYTSGQLKDVYDFVKNQGRFLPTRRTEGISTSDIITRIVRDYDEYLRRNLARGVSPRDLNIGFFKEKRLQVAQSVQEIKEEIKSELAELKDEWLEIYRTWETKSGHYIKGFASLFKHGPDLVVKFLRMKSPVLDSDSSLDSDSKRKASDEFEEELDQEEKEDEEVEEEVEVEKKVEYTRRRVEKDTLHERSLEEKRRRSTTQATQEHGFKRIRRE